MLLGYSDNANKGMIDLLISASFSLIVLMFSVNFTLSTIFLIVSSLPTCIGGRVNGAFIKHSFLGYGYPMQLG